MLILIITLAKISLSTVSIIVHIFYVKFLLPDPYSKDDFLLSPYFIIGCFVVYFYLIKVFGPKFMEKRPPYKMRNIILVYNITQIVINVWLTYQVSKGVIFKLNF